LAYYWKKWICAYDKTEATSSPLVAEEKSANVRSVNPPDFPETVYKSQSALLEGAARAEERSVVAASKTQVVEIIVKRKRK